ncbi:protein adenylyltransferase SelO [Pseudidiomarina taiwanensis]|uniref:Protein nucleotidyltransferase YdiU n=1 Tax=Pseudidiomarina taiwanensis TaxID=337250 RepID=A0A432ZMU9_9GAMM|nr:YdiU family protein [Pseudidiomarina taiwanensis]RUO79215.1 YdiU family protein [Pseudidiomarina taiwanensis]
MQSYAAQFPSLVEHCAPTPPRAPQWISFNEQLAQQLDLSALFRDAEQALACLSGTELNEAITPTASAYAGHQFAHFVPRLGDGRAILLSEVQGRDGLTYDVQLKGAGKTPFSRGGDGRSPIGPVLREYLCSEAMHALGVPTTRALAAVASGELVFRDTSLPGAILTRVARSHLRVGTFQYVAQQGDNDLLQRFADYVITRHYPHCRETDAPYLDLFEAINDSQARLIAQWMANGFIHGVMNTDNMTLSGETIDYGPCAFLEAYQADAVFSSIDKQGRYAYRNQPGIGQWNLARLAESMLALIDPDTDTAIKQVTLVLNAFPKMYEHYYDQLFAQKLGLYQISDNSRALVKDFLELLEAAELDFTLAFRYLSDPDDSRRQPFFAAAENWPQWHSRWQAELAQQGLSATELSQRLQATNPAYIPRNHLIEQVIQDVLETGKLEAFQLLLEALQNPFDERPEFAHLMQPAAPTERVTKTFCGT